MPKARPRPRHPASLVLAAAMLSARGELQSSIGRTLGVSPATVNRLLAEAELHKWYNPNPAVLFRNVPPGLVDDANELLVPSTIEAHLASINPDHKCRVSVIHDKTPRGLGVGAAAAVIQQLCDANILGVSWGWAVAGVVEGLERTLHASPRPPGRGPVQPIPVCGEPISVGKIVQQFSSSRLAERLDRVLNGAKAHGDVPSLAVSAYLTRALMKPSVGMREFLAKSPGYRLLAGADGEEGMFAKIDTLLTGIGVPAVVDDHSLGVFVRERALCEEIPEEELNRLVYGDIAGVLIPRPGLDAKDLRLVESLNEGWTGLRLSDIERCASAANESGHGGVIVVTHRRLKKDFVLELLRRGLVNRLVMDAELADTFLADASLPASGAPRGRADGAAEA